jgi:hypothetical protein
MDDCIDLAHSALIASSVLLSFCILCLQRIGENLKNNGLFVLFLILQDMGGLISKINRSAIGALPGMYSPSL